MDLPRFKDLTLVLTEQCNLRCPYCYVPKNKARTMPRSVALQAVDMFLRRAPGDRSVSISFFGGEPFLARPLMEQVIHHARARRPQGLTFSAPTNGTLLDAGALDLARDSGMELALSIDGVHASADRPDNEGKGSLHRLQPLMGELVRLSPITRMTVTPQNVDHLFDNITALYARGLRRIMHQPALELPWSPEAVESWRRQHLLLADWACQRYGGGQTLPEITVLEGIVQRLGGQPPGHCGAGVTQAAVAPDGKVFGCFRSVYDPAAQRLALGDVFGGPVNEPLVAAYSRLDPRRAKPEERGSCKGCEARDGCTVFCPAMGHALLGDLRAVGRDACGLMQVQVEICRDIVRRMRRLQRRSRRQAAAQVAAAAALTMGLGVGASACGEKKADKKDSAADSSQFDMGPDTGPPPGLCHPMPDGPQPGVCPFPLPDKGGPKPGICDPKPDGPFPGVCPHPQDGGPKPGVCPVHNDGGPKPGVCPFPMPDKGTPTPGLCNPKPDHGGPPPGVCPFPMPDKGTPKPPKDGGPKPGVCPIPGLC